MLKKLKFWITADRLGPDMPLTHILLHSSRMAKWLCKLKFRQFGTNSSFRTGAYAIETRRIAIGNNVVIRPGSMLFASPLGDDVCQITIEDFALIGSGVHIYVSNHEFRDTSQPIFFQGHSDIKPVVIGSGCWIGANAIILPGVTIGSNSVVAAGSVVTKSVPSFMVYGGNPAKFIRNLKDGE